MLDYESIARPLLEFFSGFDDSKIQFLGGGNNITFRVTDSKGKHYVLRIHSNPLLTELDIELELKWLKLLSEKSELPFQVPIKGKNQNYVQRLSEDYSPYSYCTLLSWLDGDEQADLSQKSVSLLAQQIARLHKLTVDLPKQRELWHMDGLIGENPSLGNWKNLEVLLGKDYKPVEQLRDRLMHDLSLRVQESQEPYQFIHADLNFGNIVWDQGQPRFIDFDDCGWGYPMYDISVLVESISRRENSLEAFHSKLKAFKDGYEQVLPLSKERWDSLADFVAVRRLVLLNWLGTETKYPEKKKMFFTDLKERLLFVEMSLEHGTSSTVFCS